MLAEAEEEAASVLHALSWPGSLLCSQGGQLVLCFRSTIVGGGCEEGLAADGPPPSFTCSVHAFRCPNLLDLSLSGCGHVTDEAVAVLLRSCSCLKTLQLENCVRISDRTLEAAALYADSLQTLQVDFCRNITQAGLQRFQKKRPAVTLRAERSADMIPDQKPGNNWMSGRAAKKLLWY